MSKLVWDQDGKRLYETGVDRGVLYNKSKEGTYDSGVAWNGLTGVSESPSGAEKTDLWADNSKYLSISSAENFGCTIECYTYPPEFKACNGEASLAKGVTVGQQTRKPFGFCYRTILGNDTEKNDYGYKLHLVYGCEASPSDKSYETVNDSPNAITFSYEITTTPVAVGNGLKPSAVVEIDSTQVDPDKLAQLEDILYGKDAVAGDESSTATDPRLPLPDEIATIFAEG